VSCLHDYEHWLRMHSCKMREQFSNPPSRNPNILGYRLEKLLGRGSFGVVFLAVARETKESYAIKVFNKHRVHNACSAYSIIRERNMLAVLHHPFIIRLVDSFQCSQNLYVVTDFMECGCLHDHLRLKKTFRYEEVKFMAAMLNGWLKISDMGISYALQDASCFITDPKAVGTIGYIAPIIMRKPYNFAVDWYSLGVIIFELLVGIGPECYRRERCPEAKQFEVVFPPEINAVCVDLVRRLLMRNPSFRLGNLRTKVHEVRHHPFFRDVDFIGLLNRTVQ
uniref:Protein kinase domain-containing protein n=1 Tax=Macrostomum lignano TaxID=282301 RepID=A0A1I8GWJ0_9PLAT